MEEEVEGKGGGKVEAEEAADGARQLGLMLPLKEMQLKRISRPLKDLMPAAVRCSLCLLLLRSDCSLSSGSN